MQRLLYYRDDDDACCRAHERVEHYYGTLASGQIGQRRKTAVDSGTTRLHLFAHKEKKKKIMKIPIK